MEKMQHFSIRKLSIGAASVLIGISFLGVKTSTVKADALQNTSATELTKSKAANEAIKQDTSSNIEQEPTYDIKKDTSSNIKQEPTSDIKQEPVSKTDAKQITSDQPNADQTPVKPASPKPNSNQQNAADLEAKPQTPDKVKLQSNRTITPNKAGQSKVKVTNLMAIAGKKLNAQMLSESKVMSPAKDTNDVYALDSKNGLHEHANVNDNGGYDKDYWGAIDLNNWNYTQDEAGDITLSGYNSSDNTKIIIPNIVDFAHGNAIKTITLQVNPNVDTNKVYISSDIMHDLARNATRIGLSKTENKKVTASDTGWSNVFGGETNGPSGSNRDGGIKILNPNLSIMDLHNLDTSNITDMSAMFNGGTNLTTIGDLSNWDTSKVTNMKNMFRSASSLTNIGDLNNWKTGNVTDMSFMFDKASSLTNIGNLDNWNTGKVTDMSFMFSEASNLTNIGDLSKWNTSKVTNMGVMFQSASSLTNIGNLDNWNTGNVTDMGWMFSRASNLTNIGDLSKWNTSKVTNMGVMFNRASNLTNIGDLSNWDTGNVTDMKNMFSGASNLTNIGDLSKWNTSKVTNMKAMFAETSNLTNIGNLSDWDTSNVTNMTLMFFEAPSLTNIGDLSKWKTGNVTDMSFMFNRASNLTNIGDLSNWDTGNVTSMREMFGEASNLTNIGDLSKWNTGNVTDMSDMFYAASNLTNIGDLSKWNTGNVTDMSDMFYAASNLTNIGDLAKWDTGNVTDMRNMFSWTSSLTNIGNLDNWNTSKVTDVSDMFADTKSLHNLNISNWNLTKLTDKYSLSSIFRDDANLTVTTNNITLPAWYDNELNNSGYFWNKHMAVITNNDKLLKATGDTDTLTIDNTHSARSIFYDSKGSSDAVKVLTDVNNQYIADYNKANPTKVLKLADTVDRNDPISLANASFVTEPKKFILTVHFEDVDPNADKDSDVVKQELAKTVELSGTYGSEADLINVKLPANFVIADTFPYVQYGKTDSVTLQLKHKISDNYYSSEDGEYAYSDTAVIAPDGTILIHGDAGFQSRIEQHSDLLTGQMVNVTTWIYGADSQTNVSADILNKYIEQYTPMILDRNHNTSTEGWGYALRGLQQPLQIKLKDGYTVKSIEDWEKWDNNDTYTWVSLRSNGSTTSTLQIVPLDQSVHYQFMDNGTQVGSDVIVTGKTDETVPTNLSIPENYELADGTTLPTNYTFAATNPTIQINLKHKTETSVESLPATRTINVHLPNGTTKVYQQIIGYQRDVITDLVTKTITRGTWAVNDVTSSFTIDGVKQLEQSYVLRNGNYKFASIKLPKVPGYKAVIKTIPNPINPTSSLFIVSFMALPKPVKLTPNDVEPTKTVTPATTETAELIKTDSKAITSITPKTIDLSDAIVATIPKTIDLSDDAVTTTPKEATWQIANEPERDTYRVSNGKYTVELPHINNTQLHILVNNSTKDSVLFTYKGQNTKYVFNIKFVNGHYLLTTYEIKSDKLFKLIDYNFIKSSKMYDLILNWLKLN